MKTVTQDLQEAVEWLENVLATMTEDEIRRVANDTDIERIKKLAIRATDILESSNWWDNPT